MERRFPIRQSSREHQPSQRSFIRAGTVISFLCTAVLSVPAVGLSASTSSQVPLLMEAAGDIPPAIAQAFPPQEMSKRWVKQHRAMTLNPAALEAMHHGRKGRTADVTVDLFDAGTRTLELDEPRVNRNKAKVWRGHLRGDKGSDVTLAVRGTQMAGTIASGQRLFKIEPAEGNRHRLVEIDDDAMPPDHHPLIVPDDGTPPELPAPDPELQQPGTAAATDTVPTAAAPTDTTVDLLVVYTGAARKKQGGPTATKLEAQAAMHALIALGVDLANQAYANSRIAMRLRLVKVAEVAYVETGDMSTDLTRLRSTNDGILDQVHTMRDQSKADLVAMIVENGGSYCGIAYVMANGPRASFADWAFSVTARDCVSNNTLTHELGHNMGDAHDRATGGTGVYPYSYGYRDPVGKFRTIMAYACPNGSCPRVKYFSNPRILINGRPAGIDHAVNPTNSADNARSMNEVRNVIAAWRGGTTATATTSPNSLKEPRANPRFDAQDEADEELEDESDEEIRGPSHTHPREKSHGKSR